MSMQLIGDPEGIAALKEMAAKNRDYLKFLISEAKSNTDHVAGFTAPDGTKWRLVVRPATGAIEIQRA